MASCGDSIQGRRRVLVITSVFSVIWEPSSETETRAAGEEEEEQEERQWERGCENHMYL